MPHARREAMMLMGVPLMISGMGLTAQEAASAHAPVRKTVLSIEGDAFHVNGGPTFPGRSYQGSKVEGLLFISRMANAIINDQNPATRGMWAYSDGPWDADRNTNEFIANLPRYRSYGLTSVALNIQGGNLMGYRWHQPWHTSGFTADGRLLPDYRARLIRVLDAADAADVVVNLGLFYFAAKPALTDEAAIIRATDEVTDLLCAGGYTNVLVEIGNEIDIPYWAYDIIKPERCHELIERVQRRSRGRINNPHQRLLVSASIYMRNPPPERLMKTADYILIHGNDNAGTPQDMRNHCRKVRAHAGYRGQPVLVNEDCHFDFDKPDNNMLGAVQEYTGWGLFDYRQLREPFADGFQSLPIDWGISSERKRGFFDLLAKITGSTPGRT